MDVIKEGFPEVGILKHYLKPTWQKELGNEKLNLNPKWLVGLG